MNPQTRQERAEQRLHRKLYQQAMRELDALDGTAARLHSPYKNAKDSATSADRDM